MSILSSIQKQLVPLHPEGRPFVGGAALLALFLFWLWAPLGWFATLVTAWIAYFFRDPPRVTPLREGLVVAPADGTVCQVEAVSPPIELGLGTAPLPKISIFMSVFNCHVNRAPVAGRVISIAYKPGLFINADLDKASEDNERNSLVIEAGSAKIGVVQIAGFIARRIVCFVRQGETLVCGQRFGIIRFGSRVDVYLPHGSVPLVEVGQTMVAGETILADLAGSSRALTFRTE